MVVNGTTAAVLGGIKEVVGIPDLKGEVIGYFAPVGPERRQLDPRVTAQPGPEKLTKDAIEDIRGRLEPACGLVEVRDVAGAVLGFFAPASMQLARLYAQAAARIDPDEIKRRKESGGRTYTTQEVLDHLRSLETR
jgi:hypothetical protein